MITVVTDSTIYMTREQAEELGVQVIPMRYMVSGQQYLESYSDCNGSFEGLLSVRPSATAQVPVSAFTSVFEELVRKGHRVLCIVISSRLSGAYRSASLAARHINRARDGDAQENDVVVVDSQTTAGGLYLLCKQAVKLAKSASENTPIKEIAAQVESMRCQIGIAFSLDSMDALRRSGRTGIVRQSVSTILNIKPILMCRDGAVVSIGTARGKTEQFRSLLACVPATAKELVINALNIECTVELEQELGISFPGIQVTKNSIGPVLGIHLGKGAVGLSWLDGKKTQAA